MRKRIVITGYGVINALGLNTKEFWENFQKKSLEDNAVKPGNMNNFNPEAFFEKKSIKRFDTFTQYALISAEEAINQAMLTDTSEEMKEKLGVIIGVAGNGGDQSLLDNQEVLMQRGPTRISPYYSSTTMINSPPAEIALRNGFKGPTATIVAGEAGSLLSIGMSLRKIRENESLIMIAGGTQGNISSLTEAGYKQLIVSNRQIKNGTLTKEENDDAFLSSGAGTIVIEDYEVAKARNVSILGEVLGFGTNTCGDNLEVSYAKAISIALQDAAILAKDVDAICMHDNDIPHFEQAEKAAIKYVFKDHSPVSISLKQATGNLLAASGSTQTIFSLLLMSSNHISSEKSMNQKTNPDHKERKIILINTFDYHDHNACLIVKTV